VWVIRVYLCRKHLIASTQFDAETVRGAEHFVAWLGAAEE
jgi:hypothetical protein